MEDEVSSHRGKAWTVTAPPQPQPQPQPQPLPPVTAFHNMHVHHRMLLHTSFYWSKNVEVLFPGWPGTSTGMYAVALVFVFALAVLVECLSHISLVKPGANRVAAGFFRLALRGVRAALAYMVILAVMSFNGGVFLAAVVGHAVGSLIFGSRRIRK